MGNKLFFFYNVEDEIMIGRRVLLVQIIINFLGSFILNSQEWYDISRALCLKYATPRPQ